MWGFLSFLWVAEFAFTTHDRVLAWLTVEAPVEAIGWGLCGCAIVTLSVRSHQLSTRLQQVQQDLADAKNQHQHLAATLQQAHHEQQATALTLTQQAQLTLENSQEQFRWVLQNLPIMLNAFDENGVLLVWNQACERTTGYRAAEVVGNPDAMNLFYPDRDYREQMMASWREQGNHYLDWEWNFTCKDGSVKPIAWSNLADQYPVPGWAWWGIGTDLSDLKQAQYEQQKVLDLFQTLFDRTPLVAIQGFDRQGVIHYWNETSSQLYGVSQAEALGHPIQDLLQFEKQPENFVKTLTEIAQTGIVKAPQKYYLNLPSGKIIWIYSVIVPIWQNGAITDFFCMDVDITEQQQAEAQIQQLNATLEAQNQNLEALVEQRTNELLTFINTLPDDIFVIERETMRMIFCNHSLIEKSKKAGQPNPQGQTIFEAYPENAPYFVAQNQEVFTTGQTLHVEEFLSLGNESIYVDTYKIPLKKSDGKIYALIGSSRNITELVEARQEIAKRTQQLEAINQELESFAYSVSHDLRAPLRHINGFVTALKVHLEHQQNCLDPKVEHYLEVIEHSSERMGQLIDGLLNLSRVGRRALTYQPVAIKSLVHQAIQLVEGSPHYSSTTQFTIQELPTVYGDTTLLQQVFTNLIDNAVKFSRSRNPAQIEIRCLPDQTILIKDNGVGFEMAYADQLFGAFQRLHKRTEFEGTGIGLAIVQRIMHRHGGTIWAESVVDQGTCFYLKFAPEVR
jgi:PAS domain S-box-containing protein